MKICNKVFNGGIDIVVSPYHDASQNNICSELSSYLNERNLINDRHSLCYMNIEAFFRSIKSDIMNGEKDKNYFLNEYYKDAKTIMSDLKKYLEFNESLKRLLVKFNIQVFIIVDRDVYKRQIYSSHVFFSFFLFLLQQDHFSSKENMSR